MPLNAEFGLLVLFESSEPSESIRNYLKSLNGVEIAGVWFVPSGDMPRVVLGELQVRLSGSEQNKGVAVIRVWRHKSHAGIQGFTSLAEWFQPSRERGR